MQVCNVFQKRALVLVSAWISADILIQESKTELIVSGSLLELHNILFQHRH